jgi:hypothetical protein
VLNTILINPSVLTDWRNICIVYMCLKMQFLIQLYSKVINSVGMGYTRVIHFINIIKAYIFLVHVITMVLLTFNVMKLAAHQPCICSVSDCTRVQSSADMIA